jgi:glycosyltransferase involved in cell wall biosynthesis
VIKKEKIGILIYGKKMNASKREILTAAKIINKGDFGVTLFGMSKGKLKATASHAHLNYVKLGKIAGRHDFDASLKFTKLLKDKEISTVIFRDHRSTNLLVTAKFLMKGRLRLVFIQDRHLSEMRPDFLHTFRFNQIDAWITPINQTANSVKAATHLALDKVHVLPLPIPRKPFQFDQDERSLRKSILFGDSESMVIGWTLPQSQELIQRTGRKLLQILRLNKGINVCLNLQGLALEDFFAEIPEMHAFKDVIRATPFDHHDADMYAHLDALFIDPEREPFAGITRRALMAGVLPIAPKSLVSDELLENGKMGVIYTERNNEEMFEKALNTAFLNSFKPKSQEYIGEKYTKKRFKENLEALIHALPKKARAR